MTQLPIVLDDRDYPRWDSTTGKHYQYVARRSSSKVEGRGNSPEEAIATWLSVKKCMGYYLRLSRLVLNIDKPMNDAGFYLKREVSSRKKQRP